MFLRRIGIASAAKIAGILYAGIGVLIGAFVSILALVGIASETAAGGTGALGEMVVGVGAILLFPVIYGVLGAIGGAIGAGLFNLATRAVGGLEIEIEGIPGGGSAGSYPQPPSRDPAS